jgi:beta-phosphoglucomutase
MPTHPNNFRYDRVVLDVGGTLLGFRDRAPFQEFLAAAGLPASDEDARELHRRLIAIVAANRNRAQGLGANEAELYEWWHGNFRQAWPGRPDLADEMFRWLFAGRFDRLYPDVLPALEALHDLGMPLAVLSNFGRHLTGTLARFDLLRFFDFVVISAEVGLAKPDLRIFDLVVERAGAPRERLLYVGDDIEGATGAGLDAVLIDRGDRHANALCARIASLTELVSYVQPPTHPARAIILDMDGVVLDSMPAHLRSWQEALAPLGVELTADVLYPLEGVPTEPTAQRLTEKLLGQPCSAAEASHLANTKRALFRKLFDPKLVPGIGPLLHDLHGRGYRLGLVTGSARRVVDESLAPFDSAQGKPTGVAGLFDAIVTGDDVTHGKPDPEPYRLAAGHLGLPPAECLVVENAPLGIQSASAAGMACVALQTTLPAECLSAAGAGPVFADAAALRAWLLAR